MDLRSLAYAAEDIVTSNKAPSPEIRAFFKHLLKLRDVARVVDKALGSDISIEEANAVVAKFLGPTALLQDAVEHAEQALDELTSAIEDAKNAQL